MSAYYLLRQDGHPGYWHVAFVEDLPLEDLRAGVPMDAPAAPARLTVVSDAGAPSDFLDHPCPTASDAMRRALDAAGVDNVEYFSAVLEEQQEVGRPRAEPYWVMNVVGAVACAEPTPPPPPAATHGADEPRGAFRVDARRARGLDLFRLAEDRSLLVVSARVAERLRAAGLQGVVLQRPEAYTGHRVSAGPPDAPPPTGV